MALMVPGSRMPMDRDDNTENADQAAAPPVDESLEPTDTGEDLDAKADTPQDIEEGAARQPFSPIGSRHRTTSQLAVKPPNGLRGRVVVYPEVLGDRPERPTAPTHLSRLGGDALEHRDGRRIPQLDLERNRSQGSQSLRACPPDLSHIHSTTYAIQRRLELQRPETPLNDCSSRRLGSV